MTAYRLHLKYLLALSIILSEAIPLKAGSGRSDDRHIDFPVTITNLYFNDGTSLKDHMFMEDNLRNSGEIRLRPDESSFRICWQMKDRIHNTSVKYKWILDGFSVNWSDPDTSASAVLTHVPPGVYFFRIRIVNSGNSININRDTVIKLIVSDPFIKTESFRFLLAAVCLTLLVISIFAYLKITKRKQHNGKSKSGKT